MTWIIDKSANEIVAPWGDVITTTSAPYQTDDAKKAAEEAFRTESMTSLSTDRLADYAQAWMGEIEIVEDRNAN